MVPELASVHEKGRLGEVLAESLHDAAVRRGPAGAAAAWSAEDACLHHWGVLKRLGEEICALPVRERIALLKGKVEHATALFSDLRSGGVQFEPGAGRHLEEWSEACDLFEQRLV